MKKKNNMLLKSGKKLLALVLVFVMTLSVSGLGIGLSVKAADNEYAGNLLVNGDFETGDITGWTAYGGGKQTNNPHKPSTYGFYLDGWRDDYYIKQEVIVPYTIIQYI